MYSSVEVNSQRIVHSRLAQCLFYERINSSWSKCSGPVWFSCLSSHGSLRWKFFRFYFESPEWRKCYARFAQVSEETASFFPDLQKTQSTIVAVEFRPHIAVKFIYQRALRNLHSDFLHRRSLCQNRSWPFWVSLPLVLPNIYAHPCCWSSPVDPSVVDLFLLNFPRPVCGWPRQSV